MEATSEDYQRLKVLEEGLWQTEFRFDMEWMEKILAPDFFEYGMSSRVYQRQDTLDIPSQEILSLIPLKNFKVRLLDTNVAQVTYISVVKYDKKEYEALRSSLWSRNGNNWELKFHQGTLLTIENDHEC
ncbi:MAG: nuclear transport factor 2 family protein [Methylococcales bacterium]|nr:nuclear transport factor 2 family protein [Methylococcales bacterium]